MTTTLFNFTQKTTGFSLIELMIGMALGSFLLLGLIATFSTSSAAFIAIGDRYELLQNASRGLRLLESASREAGFPNIIINDYPTPVSGLSHKSVSSDVLILEGWSQQNCFGNSNPVIDSSNQPKLFFRQHRFQLQDKSLRWRCSYGVDVSNLVIQSNNQSVINNVSTFSVRYFEDSDLDGAIDRSVSAGGWNNVAAVQQLEIVLGLYASAKQSDTSQNYISTVRLRNAG